METEEAVRKVIRETLSTLSPSKLKKIHAICKAVKHKMKKKKKAPAKD